jgi:mevalonate kinase
MEKFSSKVLIFGEYSLLYNSMALTIPFEKFSGYFNYVDSAADKKQAIISNERLRKFCSHLLDDHTDEQFEINVQKFQAELDKGLYFESNIPQGFGLGSSGALVAAIFLRYLDKVEDFKKELKALSKKSLNNLKSCLGGLECYFHGTSSGIDPLSILINKPLLVRSNFDTIPVEIPPSNKHGKNVIFLLNTNLSRNTDQLVKQFKVKCESPDYKKKIEEELTMYTSACITNLLNSNTEEMYSNLHQLSKFQLEEMNFLIPDTYQELFKAGLDSGDYYLKLCGAGGGGYMLGFTNKWDITQEKLKDQDLEVLYRF